MCKRVPFLQPPPMRLITTDTALIGWGTHSQNLTAQGRWAPLEAILNINILELRAFHHACQYFHFHIGPPNQNKAGQQSNKVLYQSSRWHKIPLTIYRSHKTMELIHTQRIQISVVNLSGLQNTVVDSVSRHFSVCHK